MQINRIARAKQFLPFDALKGLQEALKEKEIEYEERKELSEDSLYELDKIFNKIEIGNTIIIKFYKYRVYKEINGTVTYIDYNKKKILINKTQNINISDIIKILI